MSLPQMQFATPPEAFAPYEGAATCDPEPKPGVVAFQQFVLQRVGGGPGGIRRECDVGGKSEHHEGRAWDWSVKASVPQEAAKVAEVLDWLMANDAEMFRRVGLMYVIWDHQIFTPGKGWHAYTRPNPHTDHVHFSFGWPGARGETSFFTEGVELPPPPPSKGLHRGAAFVAGAVLGYAGLRLWKR